MSRPTRKVYPRERPGQEFTETSLPRRDKEGRRPVVPDNDRDISTMTIFSSVFRCKLIQNCTQETGRGSSTGWRRVVSRWNSRRTTVRKNCKPVGSSVGKSGPPDRREVPYNHLDRIGNYTSSDYPSTWPSFSTATINAVTRHLKINQTRFWSSVYLWYKVDGRSSPIRLKKEIKR